MNSVLLKYAFRNAWRFVSRDIKVVSIKVLGLAISLAVAMLIFSYIYFERSFDTFHENADRIYRVESNFFEGTELTTQWATSSFGYASAMKENLPGIEEFTRIGIFETSGVVNYFDKNSLFKEKKLAYAEPSFFKLFSFKLVNGDEESALEGAGKVIITQKTAKKYFGDENPIGKMLKFRCPRRRFECEVSGVLENFPKNSHVDFDFLISYQTLPRWAHETWYLHEAYSYVLLEPGTNPDEIVAAFPEMAEKYKTRDALKNKIWAIDMIQLKEIHLSLPKLYERESKGNKTTLSSLFLVAIAILLIAIINYVNISTATAFKRAQEVSLRKVVGSLRKHLIVQFLFESFIVFCIALLLAINIVYISSQSFIAFFDDTFEFNILKQTSLVVYLLVSFAVTFILAGLFPSILLSTFNPINALKGKLAHSSISVSVRKVLVIVQLAATIVMISGILVISKQIHFMLNQPLGFNISQKLVVEYPGSISNRIQKVNSFKEEIMRLPGVSNVSCSSSVPGMEAGFFFSNRRVEDPIGFQTFEMIASDGKFIKTYDMEIIEGRGFINNSRADQDKVIINETGMKTFGYKSAQNAVGSKVLLEGIGEAFEIIGVVKDFHQQSLQKAFPPIVFFPYERIRWIPLKTITVKIDQNINQTVDKVKTSWGKHFPENTFDTYLVDEFYNEQYKSEKKFLVILSLFAMLAIFIALIGLWSLTIYENRLRTKEIGIRRINGAKVSEILSMLNRDFIKWVAIAFVIACPIAWYVMNKWLENFAYKTTLSWWIFALAGVLALGIALLTVSWQSWRAATRNPVEALRYE